MHGGKLSGFVAAGEDSRLLPIDPEHRSKYNGEVGFPHLYTCRDGILHIPRKTMTPCLTAASSRNRPVNEHDGNSRGCGQARIFGLHKAHWVIAVLGVLFTRFTTTTFAEPPTIEPFGPPTSRPAEAFAGTIHLSDGTACAGFIYLTRDKRLQIFDQQLQRQREIPLQAVKQIDCRVKKEWMEREWRFKETTTDEKFYTGRSYPVQEYLHTITLRDGRTISGPLSGIVYVLPQPSPNASLESETPAPQPQRFLLNKRNKGEAGQELRAIVYVQRITLSP